MERVLYLTSRALAVGTSTDPAEVREHARQLDVLSAGCAAHGLALEPVPWDDAAGRTGGCVGAVVGSAWDYAERPDAFLDALAAVDAALPLWNPLALVRWNVGKGYLRELAERGVPVVPTYWLERVDAPGLRAARAALGGGPVVIKPRIGQNSWRQALLGPDEPLPAPDALPPGAALVQPFLESIRSAGELSLVFVDGTCLHAVRKRPVAGDYRIQSTFGGTDAPCDPAPSDRAVAAEVVAALPATPLYARVDLVHGPAGEALLMELELVEPYLYPPAGPDAATLGRRYGAALADRLRARDEVCPGSS